MGMFDPNQPMDSQFNYGTEAERVKRQRQIADRLMAAQQPGTQTVPGAYGGRVVRNSALTNLAPMLQQLVGAYLQGKSDDDQKALDKQSLDQFSSQYAGLDKRIRDPRQDQVEADAELAREARRGQSSSDVDAGGAIMGDPEPVAQSYPVKDQAPDNSYPLPPTPVSSVTPAAKPLPVAKAGAALLKPAPIKPSVGGTPDDQPPVYDPMTGALLSGVEPPAKGPTTSYGDQMNKVAGSILSGLGSAAKTIFSAPGSPQNPTTRPEAPQTGGASGSWEPLPAAQAGPAVPPTNVPVQTPPPMPAPVAPPVPAPQATDPGMTAVRGQVMPNPFSNVQSAPGTAIFKDGTVAQISDPDPYSRAPNDQEKMSRLIALGRTGPEGKAIAEAQLQQMFASKNGRYTTQVHGDTVNGGFVKVTTDTQTGKVNVEPINATGGAEKVLETKIGSDGNMLERTAHGWRTAQMQGGGAVMTNEGQQQQQKEADGKATDTAKLDDLRQDYQRVQGLIPLLKEVGTGRLQTPLNNAKAYVTDSTKLDNLNRMMNTESLQARIQFMHGQGSISDADARDAKSASMNPNASTQANIDAANTLLGIYKRGLDREEARYSSKYGSGTSTGAVQSAPSGMMYSWQKK